MSSVGEKRKCVTCDKLVEVIELIPGQNYWYTQKLSCGHTGRIWIPEPIEEKIEISEELKATPIDHRFGQTHADMTTEGSRSILCKKCGHTGSEHKFLMNYAGIHNCYLCDCADYEQ